MNTSKTILVLAIVMVTIAMVCSFMGTAIAQDNKILMTTGQQYQNMVQNASFESWDTANTKPTDWTVVQTPTLAQDSSVKRIGTNALKITSDIGAVSEGVSYVITVEPRMTYTFSCYYYSLAANQAELEIDGNITADLVNLTGANALSSTSSAWKRYSVAFTTVTDTQITIKLYAKPDGAAVKSAYFDGITLTEGSSTPAFGHHAVTDTGNHTMYGGLTVYGTADLKGAVNLGDLSTDDITMKGTLRGNTGVNISIVPASGQNVTVTGSVTADGLTLGANESITLDAETISHDGANFQFSDGIDFGTNVLDDTNLGYVLGWKHASDGTKIDGGDIYTETVTTTQIGTDTIAAVDIAIGAVGTSEILDGTIAPADMGIMRATAQATPDKTVTIASGLVYVQGNTLLNYAGGTANFALGGNLAYTPAATGKYVKVLITLDSAGALASANGTEQATAGAAESESVTYPVDKLAIAEVILKTNGVTAGAIANIESTAGSNSYLYRDVRPFMNLGGGNSTTATTYTIGSATNDTTTDVILAFGTTPETLSFDGDSSDDFVFSDVVSADGYEVSGTALAASHLSDGANIAHINAAESITGGWTFGSATTAFTQDVDMTYAGAENLAITSAASSAVDAVTLDVTSTNTGVVRGMYLIQNATSTQPVDVGLEIANLDADTAMSTAMKITPTGTITTGIDLGGTSIANSGNITGSGAMTVSSGSTSDLGLTGTYGVNITATAQDVAINATTATNGGVTISGPSATADIGAASDGVIDIDSTSLTIDKADAGTLKLRSVTTEYLTIGTDESVTIGSSSTKAPVTINATTLGISPSDNTTWTIAQNKTFAVNNNAAETIISMDDATRTLSAYNLAVNGIFTTLDATTVNVEHWSIKPGAVGTTAIAIEPVGVTLTGNLITAKKAPAGADVFAVDKDGNITTAGTYKGYTIGHSTHAQNTDTGTTQTNFIVGSAQDASAGNVILTFGQTNAETITFQGASSDNSDDFVFSDKVVATGLDAGSAGITNVGSISDDIDINIDLQGATDKTLGIQNTLAGVTNVTVDGSVTSASLTVDNTTIDANTWTTSSTNDITLTPGGNNILPGADGTIDLGLIASIESLSGAAKDSGTGALTLTTSGTWTTYVDNDLTYRVQIDGAGNVGAATYKWSRDGGATWAGTGVLTSGTAAAIENGLSIAFGGTGGVLNDYWDVTVTKNTGYKTVYANTVTTDKVYTPNITAENASGTVVLTGNFEITGNLTTQGTQIISGGTSYEGAQTIDITNIEALLVRKDGDDGDVFIIDTTNNQAEIYSQLGIGKVPTSGIELDVIGDADFTGTVSSIGNFDVNASKFTVAAATGNTVVAGTLQATGNVDVSSGLDITGANLTLDSNDIVVNTNKFTVDGATGNTISAGTLRSLASVGLIPEYDNATIRGDGTDNFGTLSLQYGSSHNYYEWTTNEPTTQDYEIVIRYRIPDGAASSNPFDATAPIKLWNKVSDATGSTAVTVTMLDTAGVAVTLSGGTGLKNTSWTESTITIGGTPTFTAGGYVTITIKVFADQGDTVDAGELTLKGNW